MEDKWYPLRCRIALAKELDVAPDVLDVAPVLEMVEDSIFYGEEGNFQANLMPDNKEQEDAVINNHYGIITQKIFNNEFPFEGFLQSVMEVKGLI